jgi:hypothetical protein
VLIHRLSDKPSKLYICAALGAVAAFCKLQKKKIVLREKKKKKAAAAANANASTSRSQAASSLNQGDAIPTPAVSLTGIGGIEDVD